MNNFWYAVALLVASIIGIGFFGIPYTFAQTGFGISLIIFVVLTGLVLLTSLLYGEVILRTHSRHQFVGFVHAYLGPWARRINLFTFWVSVYGAIIGILIINGQFLSTIIGSFGFHMSPVALSMVFLILATILVYAGLKTVSHVDFFVMVAAIAIILLLVIVGMPEIKADHFTFATGLPWFLPFGVILFSLNGTQGIPLVREALIGREHLFRRALMYGTLIPAGAYLMFTIAVLGISGPGTVPEGIPGLVGHLGSWVVVIGSLFGFLTSSTIFLSIVTAFRTSLREDLHLRRRGDFLLPLLPPVILFLLGVQNFIEIIGLVGGVAVSIDMILLLFVYAKAKDHGTRIPEYSMNIPNSVLYGMMLLFACGALYTLIA
ncbi:MAG: aromatic amino acid transport family protein [Patescibacteria group bacterium]